MIDRTDSGLSRFRLPTAILVLLVTVCWLLAGSSSAGENETGSSKRHFRVQAQQSIPFDQLNQQTKDKIFDVVDKPNIYRHLPVTTIQADPDYFRFLVRYPEVIVNIWQLMGVTQMSIERQGPFTVKTDDGVGTISSLELIYGNDNLHIFYGTGSYEGPVLRKKLNGECVLVMRTEFAEGPDGKPQATNQLDVFLKVENATLGLIAKTIQPIVGSTADHNFVESLKFVQRLNETTEKNGPGVQQMSHRLDIDRDVREKFIESVEQVFERALKLNSLQTISPPQVAPQNAPGFSQRAVAPAQYENQAWEEYPKPQSSIHPQSSRPIPPIIRYGNYHDLRENSQSLVVSRRRAWAVRSA